ncbi:MAG: branched-chain amino acid ABC transporter substrate-binding protein [Betaproteobacteria bacterium]|jgi:branched-chain amino acid transport system substrate-binding protein
MLRRIIRATVIASALYAMGSGIASAQTLKIAYLEGLSGPFANVGEVGLRHLQFAADRVNAKGGVLGQKIEVVPFDTKTSPQEAQLVFKQLVDQGIRYMMQGNGSAVAIALSEALGKHNAREPEKTVLYMNYGAVDPVLTNDKCNFYHFRFDADVDMKMQAMTTYMAQQKDIRKVYLINQDYAFGQSVARAARAMLSKKRPDVEIVGDDLHPLGKVKDFAPYVAKIKASGADAVISGNWGNDIALLIKASKDAGLQAKFYTYYAGGLGTPPVIGEAGVGNLKQVTVFHSNIGGSRTTSEVEAYRKRFPDSKDDFYWTSIMTAVDMLTRSMEQTKSTDPTKVALAMETMKADQLSGEVYMRPDNHQLIQPIFVSTFSKANGKDVKFDVERTGFGFKTDARIEAKDTVLPTTCKFQKPKA